MKTIYFVRHGESLGNAGNIRQSTESPLSEKGIQQAKFLAERCSTLPIEVIISSDMNRAKETTRYIQNKTEKKVEYSNLFIERRRPSEVVGKQKDDPHAMEIESTIRENFHRSDFRFSDEENFEDLKRRAKKALGYLEQRPESNILVVTHGLFMRIVMAYVVHKDKLTGEECEQFIRTFHMENTGLTVLGYDEKNASSPWWLWIWNDHSHLGESGTRILD